MTTRGINTVLLDVRVKMDRMPNPEVSEKEGIIKGVYLANGQPVYVILIPDTGELVRFTAEWFKVLQ